MLLNVPSIIVFKFTYSYIVNFLRKYYGFGSENLPEVRRIQALLHMQAQGVYTFESIVHHFHFMIPLYTYISQSYYNIT